MSQPDTSDINSSSYPLVLHHSLPQSSFDLEAPSTEVSGSGEPPKPPRRRPPTSGFWFNNGRNYESNKPIPINLNDLRVVNSRTRNAVILYKRYHAEFAGPGAAIGGVFDRDCDQALPIGNFSLNHLESDAERQRAYLIRREWIRVMRKITEESVPMERARLILTQFTHYFDDETIARLPDEALAFLVGVLPQTIRTARRFI